MIFVTGLPRSGTSFLTKLVSEMGRYRMGSRFFFKKGDTHNPDGYFEHLLLHRITMHIEKKMNGDYFYRIPMLDENWTEKFSIEKWIVKTICKADRVSLYKDNRLLIYADLYEEIFPSSKWIFIKRNNEETYRSRFGSDISRDEWSLICQNREDAWLKTGVAQRALTLDYNQFKDDSIGTVRLIQEYLGLNLADPHVEILAKSFRSPKNDA